MEKAKKNKSILNSSMWVLIASVAIIYGTFFQSFADKYKISQSTSFPWYSNIVLISAILSLPTIIFGLIYQNYYKKIYSKLPSPMCLTASFIFVLAMILSTIDCFFGKIPFSVIAFFLLIAFVLFIIMLIKTFF